MHGGIILNSRSTLNEVDHHSDVFINERRIYVNEDGIAPVCEYLFDLIYSSKHVSL